MKRKDKRNDICAVIALPLMMILFWVVVTADARFVEHTQKDVAQEVVQETADYTVQDGEAAGDSVSMTQEEIEKWHRFCEVYRECPLTDDEQMLLFGACEEFNIDYFLMLGLIERETQFRNVFGDSGDSVGYCQVQAKWWNGLMQEIGADDLSDPQDNFRTACAIIRHLFDRYGEGELVDVLTAYNSGHGGDSEYARAVICFQEAFRDQASVCE